MLAGLREKLNENPAMRVIVPSALILGCAIIVYSNSSHISRFPPGVPDLAYFTTIDSAVGNDASHRFKSCSIAFADNHCELVARGTLLTEPSYALGLGSPGEPSD